MYGDDLRQRTKQFALRILRMFGKLPRRIEAHVIGKQVLRSGTSVAAVYREASRSRSTAEFIAKMGIIEQELDETLLWLELLVESDLVTADRLADLHKEAEELLRITISSIRTAKKK